MLFGAYVKEIEFTFNIEHTNLDAENYANSVWFVRFNFIFMSQYFHNTNISYVLTNDVPLVYQIATFQRKFMHKNGNIHCFPLKEKIERKANKSIKYCNDSSF